MKKIFTLIAAMMLFVGGAFAERETELTFTEGHTLLISTLDAAGATDADIVRFYIQITADGDDVSRQGWGIGGFANSDNWTPKVEWQGKAGKSWTQEHTVAEIKEIAGTEPGQYHDIGITVNIYNDCKVEKVTLVQEGDPVEVETTAIWEGESVFGNWANGFSVAADKFASAKAGDAIEFVYTTDTEGDGTTKPTWWQIKTIYADTETTLEGNASELNSYGCATVSSGSTSYKITLTETDVANLKQKGLFANGYFLVVTKANLIQATGINAIEAAKPVQNNMMYNLAGQKVGAGYKGIVIKNGKKVIVK